MLERDRGRTKTNNGTDENYFYIKVVKLLFIINVVDVVTRAGIQDAIYSILSILNYFDSNSILHETSSSLLLTISYNFTQSLSLLIDVSLFYSLNPCLFISLTQSLSLSLTHTISFSPFFTLPIFLSLLLYKFLSLSYSLTTLLFLTFSLFSILLHTLNMNPEQLISGSVLSLCLSDYSSSLSLCFSFKSPFVRRYFDADVDSDVGVHAFF